MAGLLAAIGITGKKKGEILDLARNASEPDWLTAGIPGVAQQLAGAMECERTASGITEWSPWAVPGLLQTSDYARAVIGAGNTVARPDVEARVLVRMARRDVLNRRDLTEAVFLVGEPGLRQEIGGREIMAFQLRHLLAMITAPKVTVQVIPVSRGWHPGVMGPFVFYRFLVAPAIVHIEHHRTGVFLYDKVDVKAYEDAVASIREAAMSPHESAELINRLITELEKT